MSKILVIDDHKNSLIALGIILKNEGFSVVEAESGILAIETLKKQKFDLVITDLKMDEVDGLDIIDFVKKSNLTTEIIVITAYATIQTAVRAIKLGAYDYISKPLRKQEIVHTVNKALEKRHLVEEINLLEKQVKRENAQNIIVGKSQPMIQVMKLVKVVSRLDIPVLILGESGTGKELIADTIYRQSNRREKPFIAINCGALPENLIESELFGHLKGSFTGAHTNKRGLFKVADGGTLFLDEIGTMSLDVQIKLLRTLESGEIKPVGSDQTINVNTRLILATNSDLDKMVESKKFRSDLFFRINIFPIKLPSLHERISDIRLLANYFLDKFSEKYSKDIKNISESVLTKLDHYKWPGNIRELENVIERAVIIAKYDTISDADIPIEICGINETEIHPVKIKNDGSLSEIEKEVIRNKLRNNHWNKVKTARDLGISTTTLWRKIKRYKIV